MLCIYIDDILIAAPTHASLLYACSLMDRMASDLGVEFKHSKDIGISTPTQQIEFLGIQISTFPIVEAYPTPQKITKLTTIIHQHLPTTHIPYKDFETLIGKISFLGQFHSVLKLALCPLYKLLHYTPLPSNIPPILMHMVAPHLYHILSIFQLNLPGAFKRQVTSRYYHLSHHTNLNHIITDASGHQGYAFVTSTDAYQNFWTNDQSNWPIHTKELFAIY